MIVTCTNCATRLQLDDAKVPQRSFSVRCPKCQQIINAQPPSAQKEGSALAAVGDVPPSTRTRHEMSVVPAPSAQEAAQAVATIPAQEDVSQAATPPVAPTGEGDMARLLAALLQRGGVETGIQKGPARRPAWEPHRALVCIGTVHRDPVARALRASRYEVYVANDTSQAIERMREDRMDAVVLDNEFDMMEQGAAFINREINSMRMAERRRLVFVNLSTSARTGDAHAAFLANVNLVVNTNDVAELPHALEKCVRDLNELYRDFNKALNVAEL